MLIIHEIINDQIGFILDHYNKNIIDSAMKEYVENMYNFHSNMKDSKYSFKDNILILKNAAFEFELNMNYDVKVTTPNNVEHLLNIICHFPTLKYEFNDAYINSTEKQVSKALFTHLEKMLGDMQYNINHYTSNLKTDMKNTDLMYTRSFLEVNRHTKKHVYSFINDLNNSTMEMLKLNKDFYELALFGLNFTPYILEIQ